MFLRTSDKTEYTIIKSGSLWICLHFPNYSSKKSFASGAVMFEANNKSTKSKQEIYASLSSVEWPFAFNVEWISCKFTTWKVCKFRNFSSPYFPAFGPNTQIYSFYLRIQSEYGKIQTRKTLNWDTSQEFGYYLSFTFFEHFLLDQYYWYHWKHTSTQK